MAEFLDPHTYGTISQEDKREVFNLVMSLTTTEENTSPFELKRLADLTMEAAQSIQATKKRRVARRAAETAPEEIPLTEAEEFMVSCGINPLHCKSDINEWYH